MFLRIYFGTVFKGKMGKADRIALTTDETILEKSHCVFVKQESC